MVADIALARRLERCEAAGNASFIQARARLYPDLGATWIEVAGAYAMFDGVGSPCTQTFGFGVFEPADVSTLERLENFFGERGSNAIHEVSPLAGVGAAQMLQDRNYRIVELSTVMFLPLAERTAAPAKDLPFVRVAESAADRLAWAHTGAKGWAEAEEYADLILSMMTVSAEKEGSVAFLAEQQGQAIAAGGLSIHDGVALFAGASTIPVYRRRGAQGALLEARLEYAVNAGCDLAMMCAAPGSESQRNAERAGFRIAYTRTKWERNYVSS